MPSRATLDADPDIAVNIVWKPVLTDAAAIRRLCLDASSDDSCAGLIAWMHTFSPAKMWIAGLDALGKPLLHLHTQANVALPWATIDMDFMNLNQAAHGDREFGYIQTRLGVARKTVAGHVSDPLGPGADRHLGAGRDRLRGAADAAAGPVRRQHARRRGDRGRQGGRAAHLRCLGQHLRGQRPRRGGRRGRTRRGSPSWSRSTRTRSRWPPALRPGGDRHDSLRYAAAIELALRDFLAAPPAGGLRGVHHQLRGPRRAAPAARPGRAAADGRRLRVRRRGRLEDRGAGAGAEGDGRRPAGRHVASWRTTPTTSCRARS